MKKRIISVLLVVVMLIGMMPMMVNEVKAASFDTSGWLWPVKATNAPAGANERARYCRNMFRGYYSGHEAIDITDFTGYTYAIRAAKAGTVEKVYTGCNNFNGASDEGQSCSSATCYPLSNGSPYSDKAYFNGKSFCGMGNGVKIDHGNGTKSSYGHLSSVIVSYGDYVEQGDIIGYMGSSGASTGIHLHFEISFNDKAVNNNPIGDVTLQSSGWNGIDTIDYALESHNHKDYYEGVGICSLCGFVFDWKSTFDSSVAGVYKFTKSVTPITDQPYGDGKDANFCTTVGAEVNVLGSYTNAYGNRWYAYTSNGKTYYLQDKYFAYVGPSEETAKVSVNFGASSRNDIGKTNAIVGSIITVAGVSITDVTKVGITLYDANKTQLATKSEAPISHNNAIDMFYDINSELGKTLTAGTKYFYRFHAVIGGKTYYSDYLTFTTQAASKITVNFGTSSRDDIGMTNAIVGSIITVKGAAITDITEVGITLYDANKTKLATKSEKPISYNNAIDMYYDINGELNKTLTAGTKYFYRFHAVIDGTTYYSDYLSFTTDKCTNHNFGSWSVTKEATCTANGTKSRSCKNDGCGYKETQTISAPGHTYNTVTTEPTCTVIGQSKHTCTVCGHSYTVEVGALGHDVGQWETVKEATCTVDGTIVRHCKRDGCEYAEVNTVVAPGHKYETAVTKPTCTEKGYTTHTCFCGDSYVDSYVDPAGHVWNDGVVTKEPTEETTGVLTYTCETCGDTRTEIMSVISHAHLYQSTVIAPTCTEKGYTTYTCACGDSYKENYVEASGHAWDNGVVTTQPTEETTGVLTYTCATCGETKTEEIPTLEHTHKYEAKVTAPTCTEKGYTTYTCTCGDSYVGDEVSATGHAHSYTVTVAPTADAAGTLTGTCTACGDTVTDLLPKLSKDSYTYEVTEEPTAEKPGTGRYTWNETKYGTFNFDVTLEKLPAQPEVVLGDINDDGQVTILDLMRLANHFANGVAINEANADVNGDGQVTILDLMRLANYFAGNATLG